MYTLRAINKRWWIIAAAIVVVAALALVGWLLYRSVPKGPAPTTFGECAALYGVQGTFPRTCKVPWGKTFVEYTGNQPQFADKVRNLNLPPAAVLSASPLVLKGEAASDWYGSNKTFVVQLVADNGDVLATASARQDAATALPGSAFVPFSTTLTFTPPAAGTQGALIFKKGDGSGAAMVVPVVY